MSEVPLYSSLEGYLRGRDVDLLDHVVQGYLAHKKQCLPRALQ